MSEETLRATAKKIYALWDGGCIMWEDEDWDKAFGELREHLKPRLVMQVEDVFQIKGRGTVACGMLKTNIQIGDKVIVQDIADDGPVGMPRPDWETVVTGIEGFSKNGESMMENTVGLLLRHATKRTVQPGDAIIEKI